MSKSSNLQDFTDDLKICGLCETKSSKYCCPRCNTLYCSLDCYKSEKHSHCSEEFYRDCVNEELTNQYPDNESRNKMIEILNKLNMQDDLNVDEFFQNDDDDVDEIEDGSDSDDESVEPLAERIKGLNLDNADALWDALTQDERNEFEALVKSGDIGSIVNIWKPWWLYSKKELVVEEIKDDDEETNVLKECPDWFIPKLKSNFEAVEYIEPNITNCVAAYTFVMRYFNGEVNPLEGATYLSALSKNLGYQENFDSRENALNSVRQQCLTCTDLLQTDEDGLELIGKDTKMILQGPSKKNRHHYKLSALSDMRRIFHQASAILENGGGNARREISDFFRRFPEGRQYVSHESKDWKRSFRLLDSYICYLMR